MRNLDNFLSVPVFEFLRRNALLINVSALLMALLAPGKAEPVAPAPLPVQVDAPTSGTPAPGDAFVPAAETSPLISGKLVYMAYLEKYLPERKQMTVEPYLVVRTFGQSTSSPQIPLIVSYRITVPMAEEAFDPQFSPDGNTVLFRVGWPYDNGQHRLYLLDLKSGRLRAGPPEDLSYSPALWSPDSRFFAYFSGGDHAVGGELRFFNARSGRSRAVGHGMESGGAKLEWTRQGSLLCTAGGNIYEARPEGRSVPKLLIKGGIDPAPSPDGRWIAFSGAPEAAPADELDEEEKAKEEAERRELPFPGAPRSPRLCLYDRQAKKRYTISPPIYQTYPRWTRDSRKLVILENKYDVTGQKGEFWISELKGSLKLIDTDTRTTNQLATYGNADFHVAKDAAGSPGIARFNVSNDGQLLFVKASEGINDDHHFGRLLAADSLQFIELKSGKVGVVGQIVNDNGHIYMGYDWHDASEKVNIQSAVPAIEKNVVP